MAAPSPPNPGERLASYFENFFKTITGIATFGASITFAKILQTPVVPWVDYGFSKNEIQNYIAISFLCFVINLGLVSLVASALSLYRPQAVEWFGTKDSEKRRVVMWYATAVSTALFGLVIAAFIFVGLAVAAYTGPVGYAAVGATAIVGLAGVIVIVWQSPIGSKSIGQTPNGSVVSYVGSDEKVDHYTGGSPIPVGSRYTGKNGTQVNGGYADEDYDLWRTSVSRPQSIVPPYTADLRRLRSLRASEGSRHDWRSGQEPGEWVDERDLKLHENTQRN